MQLRKQEIRQANCKDVCNYKEGEQECNLNQFFEERKQESKNTRNQASAQKHAINTVVSQPRKNKKENCKNTCYRLSYKEGKQIADACN